MADRDDRTLLLSRLSLRQLQILSTVAEHGSILHATRSMNMTQPAVSRAVMEIERIVGQPMFVRSPRGVSPTPAGAVFVSHARAALSSMRVAAQEIDDLQRGHAGRLTIGTLPNGAGGPLPQALIEARRERPGLMVTVVEGLYQQMAASLRSGDLDFVIGRLRPADGGDGLTTQPLYRQRWGVFARAKHPARRAKAASLTDLLDAPWILPAASAPVRPMIESVFYRRGLPLPRDRMEISALGIARTLLLDCDAVMFLPEGTFRREEETGALAELSLGIDEVVEEVGLFWREGAQRRALELYFTRLLETTCGKMGLAPSDMPNRHIST